MSFRSGGEQDASVRDCNTNDGGYGAGPVLRGFEEVAAALRGFGLGAGVQADAEFQQATERPCQRSVGMECPRISSKIAGTPVFRGFQGSHGFVPSDLSPLISPWARELLHLSLTNKYCC